MVFGAIVSRWNEEFLNTEKEKKNLFIWLFIKLPQLGWAVDDGTSVLYIQPQATTGPKGKIWDRFRNEKSRFVVKIKGGGLSVWHLNNKDCIYRPLFYILFLFNSMDRNVFFRYLVLKRKRKIN